MNRETETGRPLPTTIAEYLAQLRAALEGADPAMIQDALYDAEEYLRSELAEQAGKSEAEVIAGVAGSYGAPQEVAEIYRETEITVNRALRAPGPVLRPAPFSAAAADVPGAPPAPAPARPRSVWARFFGVVQDPHAYGALFYMLLSLATGIFFFTWVVTGLSLSLGLLILIVGIPVLLLFLGSVRVLSLVEGRLVETMLGERMPRRPTYTDRSQSGLARIGAMFTDARTWSTMLYFLLMLPLGIVYFTVAITLLSLSLGLVFSPLGHLFNGGMFGIWVSGHNVFNSAPWLWPVSVAAGMLLLFVTLHLARGIGNLHGMMAKHLLVRV
ncbi:sensor domain-containing protein [Stenotrophomonas sp. YIM B06876]|uniref:sensor domain-containing protein n=1 Tax=Stenotrophomonas sp. YIM B06876 TaxID=3060211 RepID=UPI002738BE0D|nr:sensor domain-containing protein [Stenotrophomonas sp. YIM B06876]